MTTIEEKAKNVVYDDLFYPVTWRKAYQVASLAMCEFFGTLCFVMLGCLDTVDRIILVDRDYTIYDNVIASSFAWSMAYGAILVCTAHVSGHFLNPVLALIMVMLGKMSIYRMLLYTICEIAGGIAGAAVVEASGSVKGCLTRGHTEASLQVSFFYETWITFVLGLLFCSVYDPRTRDNFNFAPLKFAFSFIGLYLAMLKFTGCSMNPARSLGPAIVANDFKDIWIYVTAPFLGAVLSALFYMVFFNHTILEPGQEPLKLEE